MIARTSCSRTSKLMSDSARTPPNASEMCSSFRITSPIVRTPPLIASRRPARVRGREGLRVDDLEVRRDDAPAPILELDLGLDVLDIPAAVERVDQHRVLLGDEAAAYLARAGQLVVVRIELLVQDQEPVHLRCRQHRIRRELGVDLLDAFPDQR